MSNYKIIDNFLDKKVLYQIKEVLESQRFHWFFCDEVSTKEKKGKDNYYFFHDFYVRVDGVPQPISNYFKLVLPILNKIEVKALIRVKANLYTYAGTQIEHGFHRDQTYSHKGAILTINSNNGYTLFKDGTKIESIENRLLLFDPSEEHSSATCTDSAKRINININYF